MIKTIWLKEIREQLYTWKGLSWLFLTSLILSGTLFLLLSNVELSLLDQSEMLWLVSKIIIGTSLLFITLDAATNISTEFEKGTAETLFLAPISLKQIVIGKFLSLITLWFALFIIALPYLIIASIGGHLAVPLVIYLGLFSLLLTASFTMISFAIALLSRSSKVTISTALAILLAFSLLAFPSTAIKTNPLASISGILNPLDAAFSALDNILVDFNTSLFQNLNYVATMLGFVILSYLLLLAAMRRFEKQGVVKNE